MDENEKKIEELEAQAKTAAEEKEKLEADNKELTETNTGLVKTVEEKDEIIKKKTKDVIGARQKYKKLADMTEEEKEGLTAKELELQERQEAQDERQEKFETDQKEIAQNQRKDSVKTALSKHIGDPELLEKATKHFESIKGSDEALTSEEINGFVDTAINMLGDAKPDPIHQVVNHDDGDTAGGGTKKDFAESDAGKDMSDKLGLEFEEQEEEK